MAGKGRDIELRPAVLEWLTADPTRSQAAAVAQFWPEARGKEIARLKNLIKQWRFQAKAKMPPADEQPDPLPPAPPPAAPMAPVLRLVPSAAKPPPKEPTATPTYPQPPPPPMRPVQPPDPAPILSAASTDDLGRESFLCSTLRTLDRQIEDKADHPNYASSWVAACRLRATLHAELMALREAQLKAASASGLSAEGRRAELARLARAMSTGDQEAIVAEYLARVGGRIVAADLESTA